MRSIVCLWLLKGMAAFRYADSFILNAKNENMPMKIFQKVLWKKVAEMHSGEDNAPKCVYGGAKINFSKLIIAVYCLN